MLCKTFSDIANELMKTDKLRLAQVRSDSLMTAHVRRSWNHVACDLSRLAGGQVTATSGGVMWLYGSTPGWILDPEIAAQLEGTRDVVKNFTGTEPGWSIGNCATTLLKFVGQREPGQAKIGKWLEGAGINYQDCLPGHYHQLWMWDMASCYFNLLRRAESLSPALAGDHIEWLPTPKSDMARWHSALDFAAEFKTLRNALWGCCLGSTQAGEVWIDGKLRQRGTYAGRYQRLGLLVARTAWELTCRASHENHAVYSNTDCIITRVDTPPRHWTGLGVQSSLKGEGKAHICHIGSYHMASIAPTKPYIRGDFSPVTVPRISIPEYEVSQWWL